MVKQFFSRLFAFLMSTSAEETVTVPVEEGEIYEPKEKTKKATEEAEGEEEEANDDDDVDVDDGNDDGKERSKYIPRERFDEVNAQAKKVERLLALGVLQESQDGELYVNPEAIRKSKDGDDKSKDNGQISSLKELHFTKDEVDEASWPLVQKINQAYEHIENLSNRFAYVTATLQAENAILRDYPEFLQKEHPLRKKALEILRTDKEFLSTYRNNPERGYWAVKRAHELLNPSQRKEQMKKKGKFIVGRGEAGKSMPKRVPINSLTSTQLDELERKEHQRIEGTKRPVK